MLDDKTMVSTAAIDPIPAGTTYKSDAGGVPLPRLRKGQPVNKADL
jgi:hypothetical protein